MYLKSTGPREGFTTVTTRVGLLLGVGPNVNVQVSEECLVSCSTK